jgi:hypothetical protein
LTDPNTFSSSKCNILDVYEELGANLTITIAICNGSLDWLPYTIVIHPYPD